MNKKKTILLGLGSNLKLYNKKLLIFLPKHFEIIKDSNLSIIDLNGKFEPEILRLDNKKTGSLKPVFSSMHARWNLNGTPLNGWYLTGSTLFQCSNKLL